MIDALKTSDPRWYCVKARPKGEHIAAAHLKLIDGLEVFAPRIRYEKATVRGKVHFVSAMFPGYVFARFDLPTQKLQVSYSAGVTGLVHFGDFFPPIDDTVVEFLRETVGTQECVEVENRGFEKGDEVALAEGPFRGLKAVVRYYLPDKQRVGILLELMGNLQPVEVGEEDLVLETGGPVASRIVGV